MFAVKSLNMQDLLRKAFRCVELYEKVEINFESWIDNQMTNNGLHFDEYVDAYRKLHMIQVKRHEAVKLMIRAHHLCDKFGRDSLIVA